MNLEIYNEIRAGRPGVHQQQRGLMAVWGKEAIAFLDGLVTNNVKALGDGDQMLAAFPNAQGRLLGVVRVMRQGDRYLFETEDTTREKIFQNLFRFTFAGDFFVEDLTSRYRFVDVFPGLSDASTGMLRFSGRAFETLAMPIEGSEDALSSIDHVTIDEDELYETLRIESGIPKYGIDMDETTIVPELGLDGLISYNKGCYIGQEIIARIHFRGHVAKSLTGLVFEPSVGDDSIPVAEEQLTSPDGKNAGRITSLTFSPVLETFIALAYVRYEHLAEGTSLFAGKHSVTVKPLPFV